MKVMLIFLQMAWMLARFALQLSFGEKPTNVYSRQRDKVFLNCPRGEESQREIGLLSMWPLPVRSAKKMFQKKMLPVILCLR